MDVYSRFTLKAPECSEQLAHSLLEDAENDIKNFCGTDSVPEQLCGIQVNIALSYYNRMGQEGAKSYSEGGKSQSFGDVISPDIKRLLYRFRRLK